MACSSLKSAKYLKCLSRYDESVILEGLKMLKDEERNAVLNISKKLLSTIEEIDASCDMGPKKRGLKKRNKPSKKELFQEALMKIKTSMEDYGSRETVDKWKIDFEVGVDYDSLTIDQIMSSHHKLMTASLHVEQVRLLLFSERGRLYNSLKYNHQEGSKWRSLCKQLHVCPSTVHRYIDFYQITSAYPQLLICGLNFETIMYIYSELSSYLELKENHQFTMQLSQPLRTTTISCQKKTLDPNKLPHGGSPPMRLLSENAEWDAAWEMKDELTAKQIRESDNESENDEQPPTGTKVVTTDLAKLKI